MPGVVFQMLSMSVCIMGNGEWLGSLLSALWRLGTEENTWMASRHPGIHLHSMEKCLVKAHANPIAKPTQKSLIQYAGFHL